MNLLTSSLLSLTLCLGPLGLVAPTEAYAKENKKTILTGSDLSQIETIIGRREIVGLGEGTHGTKEFNLIRSEISKALIENKDFNYVLIENSFGGTADLNDLLKNSINYDELKEAIKTNFIAIYQNQEVLDFISWVYDLRKKTGREIKIIGIDYAEISQAYQQFERTLGNKEAIKEQLAKLKGIAEFQDDLWNGRASDRKDWFKKCLEGYSIVEQISSRNDLGVSDTVTYKLALLNIKLNFETVKKYADTKKDMSRDSAMAMMVQEVKTAHPTAKLLIWAHAGHVAKTSIYKSENGGGMGGYLAKIYPNNYFVIGTSTFEGTYAVTKDRFIKRTSKMINAKLPKAPENSIEKNFSKPSDSYQVTLINLPSLTDAPMPMRMRIAGYHVPRKDSDQFPLFDIKASFDLLVYVAKSNPSTSL